MMRGQKLYINTSILAWVCYMCVAYVLSRCANKVLLIVTPYEAWRGMKPSNAHLHVLNCLAYALVPQQQCTKPNDTVLKCIPVGYNNKSYRSQLFHLQSKKILVS